MTITYGNAPCSWGTIEGWGQGIPFSTMLDELVEAGYTGTELGDYGYMPTDPEKLWTELSNRNLTMLGAYEGVFLKDRTAHAEGETRVLRTARLLKSVADLGDPAWQPFVVLADEHSKDPERFQNAGHQNQDSSLSEAQWQVFCAGAEQIARAVWNETGLKTVFHHHSAGYVETPEEMDRFLAGTPADILGLVFDTGHYLFGTGTNVADQVQEGLRRFRDRLWYVHYKDLQPEVAAEVRVRGFHYQEAIGRGVFCELGRGCIDFAAVHQTLQDLGYSGWVTVEQDVLPGMGAPKESARRNREHLRSVTGI
ncbi:TIM barrel protein [Deinococcus cellulosilyticus]|uniref:IolE protein n=1 Tax=Deinococcus cellulosilyticus (strain DSM 18568 / NBRC 106333 / KACC 11606 / 5516J-15) TaxID=1223518 RepID=A0A511N072_DEIC1|nr:TIM barrel protein [Deinococcus cellulosilyticus]GEM46270.1 IolE protein [Deinococcus cellulosilyticus NBRC 106333 = KACC 11606]